MRFIIAVTLGVLVGVGAFFGGMKAYEYANRPPKTHMLYVAFYDGQEKDYVEQGGVIRVRVFSSGMETCITAYLIDGKEAGICGVKAYILE